MNLGHVTLKEFIVTVIYILIITIIIPSLKYVARTSKLFSVILIFLKYEELINHDIFRNISMIHNSNIPARINTIGKKILFSDILRIESELVSIRLKEYFIKKSKSHIKNPIERLYKLLVGYKDFERINISIEISSILDECKVGIGNKIITEIYKHIDIKRSELDRYIKRNRETLSIDDIDSESIRQILQIGKARLIVAKYEEMMLLYRNQLSANMLSQFISDKNLYQLLYDILNNSILPVYMNIRDTIDIYINELNGEMNGIIYKENPL